MNKSYIIELADYNVWANKKMASWIQQIADEQWMQHIVSSFGNIYETALHIASAEQVWYERMLLKENTTWLQNSFQGSKTEAIETWLQASQNLHKFVVEFDENRMDEIVSFKRLNGEAQQMPFRQIFAHVFNHSTYHRGQLITMLRQVGFAEVASTDLLLYYREKV